MDDSAPTRDFMEYPSYGEHGISMGVGCATPHDVNPVPINFASFIGNGFHEASISVCLLPSVLRIRSGFVLKRVDMLGGSSAWLELIPPLCCLWFLNFAMVDFYY